MIRLKEILENDENKKVRKFDRLKGSYSFQGHISHKKDINLRNMEPSAVEPNVSPYGEIFYDDGREPAGELITPYGFWTSTIYKGVKEFTTKWKETPWVNPSARQDYFHAYTIRGNPDIFHNGTKSDVSQIMEEYGIDKVEVDWVKIAEDYDAFHVYGGALNTDQFGHWDVESTIWFRPKDYLEEQFVWKLGKRPINQL